MNQKIRNILKRLPFITAIIKSNALRRFRHRISLAMVKRENSHYTKFLRCPMQYDALVGPVMNFLLAEDKDRTLKIAVMGCSNGSEPYTIASVLKDNFSGLRFEIHALDIGEEMIRMAQEAVFPQINVYNHKKITSHFVNTTFIKEGGNFRVKKDIAQHIKFEVGNALDPELKKIIGEADLVYAQHFLYHLSQGEATKALNNICTLLKPKAALFIDGMDLEVRIHVTKSHSLIPLDYKIEEIHNDLRDTEAGAVWPQTYWGLEPFFAGAKDLKRRYATIFFKDMS